MRRRRRNGAATRSPSGSAVEWLIDNARAYSAVLSAIRGARKSVWISQLAFDADCMAYDADGSATRLIDVLVRAARRRELDVRILLNESLLLDTASALREALSRANASGIRVRGVSRFPSLLHTKLLIADARAALVLGSPFVNGYWDDANHRPTDTRRPERELGGRPLHDLSVRVTGPVVRDLCAAFGEMWEDVAEHPAAATRTRSRHQVRGEHAVCARVAATVPRGVLPARWKGRTEILSAIEEGIAGARSLLYVEHQYLSSRAIMRALVAALARAPELEVIVLLNQNPDVTAYRGWQNERLRETKLRDHPRAGFFALWSAEVHDGARLELNQVFVHSKAIVADDAWLTIGSANIDGVSLHSYGDDFSSRLGRRVFRDVRNFDVNLVMSADPGAMSESIGALRRALWTEHLGDAFMKEVRPPGGWLRMWRERAARNVAALNSFPLGWMAGEAQSFVLPYSDASTPAAQLASVGVCANAAIDLRFKPSWLEVHCSPNWIRNMFA